jgi:hypothetical protein
MKHLKNFKSLLEEDMTPMDIDPSGMESTIDSEGIPAEEWIKSSKEEGDYDVTWTNENGEVVTASFADATPGPMTIEDNMGYLTFETLEGTSSDGNEYIGRVTLEEKNPTTFEIVGISVIKK